MSCETRALPEITFLGHACALLAFTRSDGGVSRFLLDPGNLTPPLHDLPPLDAVLITHAHPDHLDPEQIARISGWESLPILAPAAAVEQLIEAGAQGAVAASAGDHEFAGIAVRIGESTHETIYPGIPLPENLTYLIGDVFAPGDSFCVPDTAPRVLLAPTGAPWMKLAETIDYIAKVAPAIAVPVHDAGLAPAHRALHRALMQKFAPEGTEIRPLDIGESLRG